MFGRDLHDGGADERAATAPGGRRPGLPGRRSLIAGLALAMVLLGSGAIVALAGAGAPGAETESAAAIGRTSVVLEGLVNPNSSAVSECYFEYGSSESSLSHTADCSYSPGEGETPVPVNATLEGLPESTSYYYRIHARSAEGESSGGVRGFTTLPTAPVANTEPASAIGHNGATLDGLVTPNDAEVTECFFEYGSAPNELSSHVACSSLPGSGSEPVQVHATLASLPESTVYYYRLVARNSFALEHGGRTNFETLPAAPRANTEPAINVGHTTATLRGFVTPNGSNIESCRFEYGSQSVEENTIPCEQSDLGAGETPVAVTAAVSGLSESTSYHVRLIAGNARGTGTGGGVAFATLPFVPKTLNQRPTELSDETALLHAKVDPQDEATTACTFEYGTTPAFGRKAACNTLPATGEKYVPVSAAIGGLSPTTTYLWRIRVADASGVTYGKQESFTTFKVGLAPSVTKLKPRKGASNGANSVTIDGQNLLHATAVRFGESAMATITSDAADSITVIAPPGVGVVDVVVSTESGESAISAADEYTYGKPVISSVSPNHGPTAGGTEVTVDGYGFALGSETTFLFGKNAATDVECASSTSCTMTVPGAYKGKAGKAKVQAKVSGKGSASAPAAIFEYEA